MRKKTHLSLGRYLIAMTREQELKEHRKAFLLGSILPDCFPNFVTRRHEFDGTFLFLQNQIRRLTTECNVEERVERVDCRRMGEVIHYVADYFTFPHNGCYPGNVKDHCMYEKELKLYMRRYLCSGRARLYVVHARRFVNAEELFAYIEQKHTVYLAGVHNVETDARFIAEVCLQVLEGMYQLLQMNKEMSMAA